MTREGKIHFNPLGTSITLPIESQDPTINRDLARLQNGDFIHAKGEILTSPSRVFIEDIHYVGLRRLLGVWTNGLSVFNFSDYDHLTIYNFKPQSMALDLNYSVAPEDQNGWSINFFSSQEVKLGHLEFVGENLRLSILNPKTGRTKQVLNLRPKFRQPSSKTFELFQNVFSSL